MNSEVVILLAEDDPGHKTLIEKNLRRDGMANEILHFCDGQEILDFLFKRGEGPHRQTGVSYLLLLDIRMPKIDGTEVLAKLKEDPCLRKMPVIMITTTDDPMEINKCHKLGCNNYIVKPVEYADFIAKIRQLGFFLKIVEIPGLNGPKFNLEPVT